MSVKKIIALFCLTLAANATLANEPATLHYQIIAERSHKTSLFTQGLLINGHQFYESSGLYHKSLLVSYPVAEPESTWAKMTAPFTQKQSVPDRFFAEGLALLNNKLYQLTWQEGALFVYDAHSFSLVNTLYYKGEGWGLTTDGKSLIRSDGSANLYFHHAENFALEKTITVMRNKNPVANLNELEYADGFIWANIWHDNSILKINPTTGEVVASLDLNELANKLHLADSESVLNGIAYDIDKKAFWITGKQWPRMYLLKIQ